MNPVIHFKLFSANQKLFFSRLDRFYNRKRRKANMSMYCTYFYHYNYSFYFPKTFRYDILQILEHYKEWPVRIELK